MRTLLSLAFTVASASFALAGIIKATPGPVVGLIAGPWGIVGAGLGYGAYRAYKALRRPPQ